MSKYRVVVSHSHEKECYVAYAPELVGCKAEGSTRAEALGKLEEEIEAQVKVIEEQGEEPPIPLDHLEFSGNLQIKITSGLHRELSFLAVENNTSLDVLITELLGRSVEQQQSSRRMRRTGGKDFKDRSRREGQGQRYHDIMGNRADFIEYVRGLDGGKARGSRGGKRGGH
ncbi:MAG: type II toxin-antitoxin system HicB family antitoxin [Pseudomonadota bacterium]